MAKARTKDIEDLFRASVQAEMLLKSNSKALEADRNLATQFLNLLERSAWVVAFIHADEITGAMKMRKKWKKRKKA